MPRGFHFWQSQPLDRVTPSPPWLVNPRLPAMSPHGNGTRHLSHFYQGKRMQRMNKRLNKERGRQETESGVRYDSLD